MRKIVREYCRNMKVNNEGCSMQPSLCIYTCVLEFKSYEKAGTNVGEIAQSQ